MGLAPTASSTCPSHEEINTLHRNVKHLMNIIPILDHVPVELLAGQEWSISTCLTLNKPVLLTGTSTPFQLEDVHDLQLVDKLVTL